MRLVFIAGPYKADTDWERSLNVHAARLRAAEVWKVGACAICPHTNSAFMNGVVADAAFYQGALEMMWRCDAVLTVPLVWEQSHEARYEVSKAYERGIPVFHSLDDLCRWLRG